MLEMIANFFKRLFFFLPLWWRIRALSEEINAPVRNSLLINMEKNRLMSFYSSKRHLFETYDIANQVNQIISVTATVETSLYFSRVRHTLEACANFLNAENETTKTAERFDAHMKTLNKAIQDLSTHLEAYSEQRLTGELFFSVEDIFRNIFKSLRRLDATPEEKYAYRDRVITAFVDLLALFQRHAPARRSDLLEVLALLFLNEKIAEIEQKKMEARFFSDVECRVFNLIHPKSLLLTQGTPLTRLQAYLSDWELTPTSPFYVQKDTLLNQIRKLHEEHALALGTPTLSWDKRLMPALSVSPMSSRESSPTLTAHRKTTVFGLLTTDPVFDLLKKKAGLVTQGLSQAFQIEHPHKAIYAAFVQDIISVTQLTAHAETAEQFETARRVITLINDFLTAHEARKSREPRALSPKNSRTSTHAHLCAFRQRLHAQFFPEERAVDHWHTEREPQTISISVVDIVKSSPHFTNLLLKASTFAQEKDTLSSRDQEKAALCHSLIAALQNAIHTPPTEDMGDYALTEKILDVIGTYYQRYAQLKFSERSLSWRERLRDWLPTNNKTSLLINLEGLQAELNAYKPIIGKLNSPREVPLFRVF